MRTDTIACPQCAAQLFFSVGVESLRCAHCDYQIEIGICVQALSEAWEEKDYHATLDELRRQQPSERVQTVKCDSCGAETAFGADVCADDCAYCGVSLVRAEHHVHLTLRPQAILPFKVERALALEQFRAWLRGLPLAPNRLKRHARIDSKLQGVFVPYWTFDCKTETRYEGKRGCKPEGDAKRMRWEPAAGTIEQSFDDILILASASAPREHTEKLYPWDLQELLPYNGEYLRGFRAECFSCDLESGFKRARQLIEHRITRSIRADIGGDDRQIDARQTSYRNLTYKYILLPVWFSAFRYQNKVYHFLVNGRTGEIQGDYPRSWIKVALLILLGLGFLGAALLAAFR